MIVFLTGASGYVGRSILRALRQHRHEVLGLARSDSSAAIVERLGGTVVRGDLADPQSFAPIAADADVVIHAGFNYAEDGSEVSEVDIAATEALGAACEASRCRHIIYTSSLFTYRSGAGGFDETHAIPKTDEEWRCDLERRFLADGRTTARTAIRLPWVYGGDGGTLIDWLRPLVNSPDVAEVAALRVPFVHVDDLAALYVLAAEQRVEGVLHGVTQYGPVGELFACVGRIAGVSPGLPASIGPRSVLRRDIPATTARGRAIGWTPQAVSLDAIVEESLRATERVSAPA